MAGQVQAVGSPPSLITTKTPPASARQLQPAQVQHTGERKTAGRTERERRRNDEQMMDRADVEERGERSSDELRKSVTGLSLH